MDDGPVEIVPDAERRGIAEHARGLFRRLARVNKLLIGVVIIPTTLATVYFGFVAHDVFLSESHFIVRNQQHQTVSGIGSLLQGTGLTQGHDEA